MGLNHPLSSKLGTFKTVRAKFWQGAPATSRRGSTSTPRPDSGRSEIPGLW